MSGGALVHVAQCKSVESAGQCGAAAVAQHTHERPMALAHGGAPYLDCLGEEEQRNHDLALNGIFLETIDTVASTANTAVYAVLSDSFH